MCTNGGKRVQAGGLVRVCVCSPNFADNVQYFTDKTKLWGK